MWLHLDKEKEKTAVHNHEEPKQEETKEQVRKVHIKRKNGEVVDMELEEYLIGVVGSEMSASFASEALKAQAVAARTFVAQRNFEVDDTTASQVFQDEEQLKQVWKEQYSTNYEKIKEAVNETKGKVITYQGKPITAAFFSSCNGYTNNSEDYWSNAAPYLRSVESAWDKQIEGNQQEVSFSVSELSSALGFQNDIKQITDIQRYENGYVKSVAIDGIVFSGREIREALSLRSSAFQITADDQTVVFKTEGFGHGIGMSQYGAKAMAEAGYDYTQILKHYYTGVEISDL